MMHHEQLNLIPLVHRPLHPPRAGHVGEQVFASIWEAHMAVAEDVRDDDDVPFLSVLGDYVGPITQRQATAVASVVCWLGTACGLALMRRAKKEADAGHWDLWHAYLLAWTLENHRRRSLNHGVRTLEYMMAPAATVRRDNSLCSSGLTELPTLGADELEAVDHLMVWLATTEGQVFLNLCDAELGRLLQEQRLAQRAQDIRDGWTVASPPLGPWMRLDSNDPQPRSKGAP